MWIVALAVLIVGSFAYLERRAIRRGEPTLSLWFVSVGRAWPAFAPVTGLVTGFVIGFLTAHFWWHWCP